MPRKQRPMATCHPNKPHQAKGLCLTCYSRLRYHQYPDVKVKKNAAAKVVRRADKDRHMKSRYGLTFDDIKKMSVKQDNKCALCDDQSKKLFVDHSHETGKVRGLLCPRCNFLLGGYEIMSGNPRLKKYLIGS